MKKSLFAAIVAAAVLSSGAASADTFEAGSMIIPMDTTYQDSGMLRAFGLVYRLLQNGVPVRWSILRGKPRFGVDFTSSSRDHRTNAAVNAHSYRGGPWIIDSTDRAKALPIIDAWQASNPSVAVHDAIGTFNAPVSRYLVAAPKTAMHADGNQKIARSYMVAAGIPDSLGDINWPDTSPDMLTPLEVAGPTTTNKRDGKLFDANGTPNYCQFMSMHWGVGDARNSPETVAEVRQFLNSPTHFFAECQAVTAFESTVASGYFVSTTGLDFGIRPSTYDYLNHDEPFAQMDGAFLSVGGSEPSFSLFPGGAYKAGDITMIKGAGSAPGINDVWMTGYLDGICPPDVESCGTLGKVSYLGGHQYPVKLPISANPETNGTRLFLNALFEAPCSLQDGAPNLFFDLSAPLSTTTPTLTYTLTYLNQGPGVAGTVSIDNPLPAGTTFVSASAGGTLVAGKVHWDLGNVGVNAGSTVTFTVTLGARGTFLNSAMLTYFAGLTQRQIASNGTTTVYDTDTDGDGVVDGLDNCPSSPNPSQNLATDMNNCGACGRACAAANGTASCSGGTCSVVACNPTHSDCNTVAADGCEYANTGFQTDPSNCNGCGRVCGPGTSCVSAACVANPCAAGTSNCNGNVADGCEYNNAGFATDPANCGGCGLACTLPNATATCVASACAVGTCAAGRSDCNGLPGDGCEVDNTTFATSAANCGGCNRACAPPNAVGSCNAGTCRVGACLSGHVDLDGDPANGCELACTKTSSFDTTCNGVDEDCNGTKDDGYVPVRCGIGACARLSTCAGGVATCVPGTAGPEGPFGSPTCNDGVDNNCDGAIDAADLNCLPPDDAGASTSSSGGTSTSSGGTSTSSGGTSTSSGGTSTSSGGTSTSSGGTSTSSGGTSTSSGGTSTSSGGTSTSSGGTSTSSGGASTSSGGTGTSSGGASTSSGGASTSSGGTGASSGGTGASSGGTGASSGASASSGSSFIPKKSDAGGGNDSGADGDFAPGDSTGGCACRTATAPSSTRSDVTLVACALACAVAAGRRRRRRDGSGERPIAPR